MKSIPRLLKILLIRVLDRYFFGIGRRSTTRLASLIGYDTEKNNGEVEIHYNFVFDVADNDTLYLACNLN